MKFYRVAVYRGVHECSKHVDIVKLEGDLSDGRD